MTDPDILDDLFLDEGALKVVDKGRGKYQPKGKKEGRPATVPLPEVVSEVYVSNNGRGVDKDGPVNESFSTHHLEKMIFDDASALDVTERSKDASPLGAGKYSDLVALETTLVRHSGPDDERYAADNLSCSEDSHIVHHQSNVCQAVATDSANELSCDIVVDDGTAYDTSHAEHELSDLNRDSVMETEKLDAKNADEQVAPFDDILSESLSSIACGVGKFYPKPRSGELTVKSKQPRKVANLAAAGAGDVLGEYFRSFNTNQLQDEQTQNNSELDVPPQNSNRSLRPARKRKNESEERNPTKEDPPKKKFPHSTRRKRRQVEKALLETPVEDIDSRKLRIRDLIVLSEARERMSVKSGSVGLSGDDRRNDVSHSSNSYYYEENAYTGGEDLNPEDEDADHEVDTSAVKLNYHSFMKRSGRERWSKTDMELFYQAIRQFGTDFAMIQQLFPNRTRHQVHLKFKSEERKHPLQIADALVHRSKDYSHFKQVIEQLKTKAEKDDADDPTSEYQDADTTAPDEVGGIKKSDGEDDQEIHDIYYGDGSTKYDDEEAYDWNEYDHSDAQYKFDDDY